MSVKIRISYTTQQEPYQDIWILPWLPEERKEEMRK